MNQLFTKLLFLLSFGVVSFTSYAQDTLRVDQFCQVAVFSRPSAKKLIINIDYGEGKGVLKDFKLKEDNGDMKEFNSIVEALNYMGGLGWKMVNAFSISYGLNGSDCYYVFKKEFLKPAIGQ